MVVVNSQDISLERRLAASEEAYLGFFITFEGIEGSGKTTQADMLKDHLEWLGKEVVGVREPGSTQLGERLRAILVNVSEQEGDEGEGIDLRTELLLYEACRAQLVSRVIKPSLEAGKVVICDRYIDSTVAYQSGGRGLPPEPIISMNRWASYGVVPDLTFFVDCTPELGLERAKSRVESNRDKTSREDRFEQESLEFHTRVMQAYMKLVEANKDRIRVVDGNREIAEIHKDICGIIEKEASAGRL